MAASKHSMTAVWFTEKDIQYNRMNGHQQGQCKLKKSKLDCVDKDGQKYSIKIRDLKGIEMHGTYYSVNKHRHENIIALTNGNNIKFLKFDNRDDMERWYSELMKPLRREGWIEEADETQPGRPFRRCASSPAVKPNKPMTRRPFGSAHGSLQQGFDSKADRGEHVYEDIEGSQSSGSSTDSSDGDGDGIPGETETEFPEDLPGNDSATASVLYENTKNLSPSDRRRNQMRRPNIRVFGDNNIVINQQSGCGELNISTKPPKLIDEAVHGPIYVGPTCSSSCVSDRHIYVNHPVGDTGTASTQKRKDIPGDYQTTISANKSTYMECGEDNTNVALVRNPCKSKYTRLIINQDSSSTRAEEQVVSTEPQLTKLKPKPPPVAAKPKSKHTTFTAKNATGDENSKAVHSMKQSTDFKAKLSTILQKGLPMKSSNSSDYLDPRSEHANDNNYIDIDKSTYSPTELNEDRELYEIYEHVEQPQQMAKLTQKSKSPLKSHILSLNTPSQVRPRKQSVPLPVSNSKETLVTTDQPQLPLRNGTFLLSSVSSFKRLQQCGSIEVFFINSAISNGNRLDLSKVKGLPYIWINGWDPKGPPLKEKIHPGDQILSINGKDLKDCDVTAVYKQIRKSKEQKIAFQLRRAPHAKVVYLQSSAGCCDLGIDLDGNVISKVNPDGLFSQVSKSKTTGVLSSNLVEWAITEINMQPVNHNYSSKQIQELLDKAGPRIALVIQPSDLVLAMMKAYQP